MIIYTVGSTLYGFTEIFLRGFTHWTMIITGGVTLIAFFILNQKLRTNAIIKTAVFSLMINAIELILGIILNIILKMKVWDYSARPFNILGQICLKHGLMWIPVAVICVILCKLFSRLFAGFNSEYPYAVSVDLG